MSRTCSSDAGSVRVPLSRWHGRPTLGSGARRDPTFCPDRVDLDEQVAHILLDQLTMNQLGEFATFEEAEEAFFRFVKPHPPAAEHLEIWRDDGKNPERLEVDPEKIRRVTVA